MNLNTARVVVMIASFAITAGLYSQAYRLWERKSVDDLSCIIIMALLFNEVAWLNYGWVLSEWPIVLISFINLPAIVAIGWAYKNFRKKGGNDGCGNQ